MSFSPSNSIEFSAFCRQRQQFTLSTLLHFAPKTMSKTKNYEQSDDQASVSEMEVQRRPHRGGKSGHHVREEPTFLTYLQACLLAVTCFRHMSCYEICGRPCSSGSMHTWRSCWRRPTKTKDCWGTWKITTGLGCMFVRQRWKCSKGGWPRLLRGRRRPTHSASWPRLPSLTMTLISLFKVASTKNFGSFGSFLTIFGNLQVLASQRVAHRARPFMGET